MSVVAYTTTEELGRILKISAPTAEQTAAMVRVLTMAGVEIDAEIDLAVDATALTVAQLELAAEVNLERAVELWRAAPFGIVGIDSDLATHTARNTWERYAHMLAPLKNQFGLA